MFLYYRYQNECGFQMSNVILQSFLFGLGFLYKTVFCLKSAKILTLLSLVVFHHCGDCSGELIFGKKKFK